jgi:hypothetical protein
LDILELFGDVGEPHYSASLWMYGTAKGVVGLGGSHTSIDDAEEILRGRVSSELSFIRERIPDGDVHYASRAYSDRVDVAVVTLVGTGDIVSRALLPDMREEES